MTSGASGNPTSRIVFVCEHGAVKSVLAAEHFNRLARARGLEIEATPRGIEPDPEIPELVRQALSDEGFDVSRVRPTSLGIDDLSDATLVISLDADVESIVAGTVPIEQWNGLPSVMENYASGSAMLVARVEALVSRLERDSSQG